MNAATPRVTVLMTLYNKGPWVEEAVQSVLAQTFTDFELLVVDDASTDGGLEKVKAIHDPRIRILECAVNTGRAAAANRGYDAARGEFVAVLDADDLMHPERLARQVAFLDAHPEIGLLGTACQAIGQQAHVGRWPATNEECQAKLLFGDPALYPSTLIRRSIVEEHHLRCNVEWRHPGMDYLFLFSFGPFTRYANLPDVLMYYRMGENNMRHGRDPVEVKGRIIREVFRLSGIAINGDQLELQLALHDLFRQPFDATRVKALHLWTKKLAHINRERHLFPEALFEAELQHRWQRLFHRFADHDLGAALAHLRLSGRWPLPRLMYLAKATINRWTGRRR
jgi:glycosyltransferase involved in cell wall biosynthesis